MLGSGDSILVLMHVTYLTDLLTYLPAQTSSPGSTPSIQRLRSRDGKLGVGPAPVVDVTKTSVPRDRNRWHPYCACVYPGALRDKVESTKIARAGKSNWVRDRGSTFVASSSSRRISDTDSSLPGSPRWPRKKKAKHVDSKYQPKCLASIA